MRYLNAKLTLDREIGSLEVWIWEHYYLLLKKNTLLCLNIKGIYIIAKKAKEIKK